MNQKNLVFYYENVFPFLKCEWYADSKYEMHKQYSMFKLSLYPGSRDIRQELGLNLNFNEAERHLFHWIQ